MPPLPSNPVDKKNEVWKRLSDKYLNLLRMAASKITGDSGYCIDDYIQELSVVLMKSLDSYIEKEYKDTSIRYTYDDVFNNKELNGKFDKWAKTCVWNAKNTIGKKISVKMDFYNKHISFIPKEYRIGYNEDNETPILINKIKDIKSNHGISEFIVDESLFALPEKEQKIVSCIIGGNDVFFESGELSPAKVAREIGITFWEATLGIKNIKHFMQKGVI